MARFGLVGRGFETFLPTPLSVRRAMGVIVTAAITSSFVERARREQASASGSSDPAESGGAQQAARLEEQLADIRHAAGPDPADPGRGAINWPAP